MSSRKMPENYGRHFSIFCIYVGETTAILKTPKTLFLETKSKEKRHGINKRVTASREIIHLP